MGKKYEKDEHATILANKRWKTKTAHIKEAQTRRRYWSKFTPDQRKEIMNKVRAGERSKARLPGLPENG
jgi:hypothetical protein